jgi:tripartite-type tricarboxylate transporter receptor subunit TctC
MIDRIVAGLCAGAMLVLSGPAFADDVADFYKGKTVTLIVPSGSGGSYHLYCQLVQRNIARYIPGKPTVIVQNRPGAGGALAAAYMANAAPKDGTVIAEIAPGSITDPLVRKQKYDARTFKWLGSIAARPYVLFTRKEAGVASVADLKKKSVTMAASGKASASYVLPSFANALLGTKMKIITGYKGGGALTLAVERGEADGRGNFPSSIQASRPHWFTDGSKNFLLAIGPPVPELTDRKVPFIRDFLKPDSVEAKVAKLLDMNFDVGQGFYVSEGVPAARVAALRKAFDAMLADPATKKDVEERKLRFVAQSGAEVEAKVKAAFAAADATVVARFKQIMLGK